MTKGAPPENKMMGCAGRDRRLTSSQRGEFNARPLTPPPPTLTYEATPPLDTSGDQSFQGTLSADGKNNPITGPQTASDRAGAMEWLYYQ